MSNIYVGTSLSSSGEGNYLDVTVTNSSGAAWANPLISVIAKVGSAYYTAFDTPATVATAGTVDFPISLSTNTYGAAGDYVHAGIAFVGTATTY